MQNTVDSKRQFLYIQGNPFQPVYSSKSYEYHKKISASISGKVKKIEVQEKVFSYKKKRVSI